jgi:hypothetical protein
MVRVRFPRRSVMKTSPLLAIAAALACPLFLSPAAISQEATPAKPAAIIQVPVRVLDAAGRFVDSLGRADFEVVDGGLPCPVEAVYFVEKGRVVRAEGLADLAPKGGRRFYLFFQMTEYDAKLEQALDHLFLNVLAEGDSMTIVTPMKPYTLTPQALRTRPAKELARETHKMIRKDIMNGANDYRSLLMDLKRIVRAISGGGARPTGDIDAEGDTTDQVDSVEMLLPRYRNALGRLENLRLIEEGKFLAVAENLRRSVEPIFVYFFYQREYRPEISPTVLSQLLSSYQDRDDIRAGLSELFQFYKRDFSFDSGRIARAFADAGAPFSFIFMSREAKPAFGVTMTEQSEDVFKLFSEIARATGGAIDNSNNPAAGFKSVANAENRYYLVKYYAPEAPKTGEFRTISVTVRGRPLEIVHRTGYFAR